MEVDGNYNLLQMNVFMGGELLATYSGTSFAQSNWHYALNDWVGTKRVVANNDGTISASFASGAFGDATPPPGLGGNSDTILFTGKDRDTESNLDYFAARYYNSNMSRFMSPDPSGLTYANPYNPQSLNLYSYVLNNPLSSTDPNGLVDCSGQQAGQTNGVIRPSIGCSIVNFFRNLFSGPGSSGDDSDPTPGGGGEAWGGSGGSSGGTESGGGAAPQLINRASSQSNAPSNPTFLQNPCPYQGRALPPSTFAAQGKAANDSPINFTLDVTMGFPAGNYLDPQPLGSGNPFQNQAYGNYTFGVYMQSAGLTLSRALSGANGYAAIRKAFNPRQYANQTMDPNYPSLPAASVANITNGFNAQASGTTCHN